MTILPPDVLLRFPFGVREPDKLLALPIVVDIGPGNITSFFMCQY